MPAIVDDRYLSRWMVEISLARNCSVSSHRLRLCSSRAETAISPISSPTKM